MIKAVIFDVDGTLIDDTIFIWQSLHQHFNSDRDLIRGVMQRYMSGEITYADWFNNDIEQLKAGGATRARIG